MKTRLARRITGRERPQTALERMDAYLERHPGPPSEEMMRENDAKIDRIRLRLFGMVVN